MSLLWWKRYVIRWASRLMQSPGMRLYLSSSPHRSCATQQLQQHHRCALRFRCRLWAGSTCWQNRKLLAAASREWHLQEIKKNKEILLRWLSFIIFRPFVRALSAARCLYSLHNNKIAFPLTNFNCCSVSENCREPFSNYQTWFNCELWQWIIHATPSIRILWRVIWQQR